MGRKNFLADITTASEKGIPNVMSISRGDDDGDVNFCFLHDSTEPIEVQILALDVSEYPYGNSFMVFTKSHGVPKAIDEALSQVNESSNGMSVADLISQISKTLQNALSRGSREAPINLDDEVGDEDHEMGDGSEDESDSDSGFSDQYEEDFPDEPISSLNGATGSRSIVTLTSKAAAQMNRRIRADVRAVRMGGFRIGILSGMKADSQSSILSISVQATKLGLSEEAMQAWDIEPTQYLTLLIRYSNGYKTYDSVIAEPAKNSAIDFRIGVSNSYKPSPAAAFSAFSDSNLVGARFLTNDKADSQENAEKHIRGFSNIFISSSLNEFINTKMISILKLRRASGLGWEDAKECFDKRQGRPLEDNADLFPNEHQPNEIPKTKNHSSQILSDDHFINNNGRDLSFPLLAGQFALMYLVRCTEFCLVCHDRMSGEFEALKPYVCDKPLCLYQYMSLGFGPSVEHEIQTQPYVTDLLVSFCYSSAKGNRIREYPTGMSLSVPPPIDTAGSVAYPSTSAPTVHSSPTVSVSQPNSNTTPQYKSYRVTYDSSTCEVKFDNGIMPIKKGDWVRVLIGIEVFHFRVKDTTYAPVAKLSAPVTHALETALSQTPEAGQTQPVTNAENLVVEAELSIYSYNFDDMSATEKCSTITMLLDTLPSIRSLREYIDHQCQTEQPNLRKWVDRISPAALGLLRWVIASNRSCLVQVDTWPDQKDSLVKVRYDQKVSQIDPSWVQFRFAQGSPDKELRFLNALKEQRSNLNSKYPTIFAFHGSPLPNWHSIIRHGLDFKETLHGRAYGHGVYHAQDQSVSCGYAASRNTSVGWPKSQLNPSSVMSINEIINCPQQFISSLPYIVVQHIDWIQCRFLLVQIDHTTTPPQDGPKESETNSRVEIEQDPQFTAKSTYGKPIGVPYCAASVSRAFRSESLANVSISLSKKPKGLASLVNGVVFVSEEEDLEDINFLLSDTEDDVETWRSQSKKTQASVTDFVPGSLDQASLPMLNAPTYATSSATMRLNRELASILKVQESTPLHELGWYIDQNLVSNIYQWIIELHSFDSALPLAKDLKESGQTSVVIEIRFGKDYPHSPPFVRVIKPRFLPFMSGGGGHVTAGGALCMELLTNSGWSAVSSIESVLLQVRLAIMSTDPKPARLENNNKQRQGEYSTHEAMAAFVRACQTHGWEVPKDFHDFAATSLPSHF